MSLLQKSLFVIPEVFIGNPGVPVKTGNQFLLDTRFREYDNNSDSLDTFARGSEKTEYNAVVKQIIVK